MQAPLRCHLYREVVGGRVFRLITPRPIDGLVVSTNRYHETWHIVSAPGHVRTIRRLVWAAAFDDHCETLFVVAGGTLAPTPFDGARSRPLVILCAERTHVRADDVRALLGRLRRRRKNDGTVKLQTPGLERMDALDGEAIHRQLRAAGVKGSRWSEPRVALLGGAIVLSGTAAALRYAANAWSHLERALSPGDSSHEYVDRRRTGWPEGEVQVFADYAAMLVDARIERARLLAAPGDVPRHEIDEVVCARRQARTARRTALGAAVRRR